MEKQSKNLVEKMVDFKHFGIVLLAIGAFFYLGVIIPNDTKTAMDLNIMILSSMCALATSMFFFIQSKHCEDKITEIENGESEFKK